MKLSRNLVLTTVLYLTSLNLVNGLINKGLFQDLPISCITCNDEKSCQTNDKNIKATCEINTDTCVTVFGENDKVIKRGCYTDIYKTDCETNVDNKCYECKSNLCNAALSLEEYFKCYDCTTFDNPECGNIIDEKSTVPTRDCRQSCMSTLVYLDDTNTTLEVIRSCLDDKEEKDQEECKGYKCKVSKGNLANGGLFPENHLQCYHCEEAKCQSPTKLKNCENIQENDKCIIQYEKPGLKSKFGCLSDLKKDEIKDLLIANKLFICEGKGCNTIENEPKATICTACTSSNTRECITDINNDIVKTSVCDQVPNTKCYTKFDNSTGLVDRGCWTDLQAKDRAACLDENDENCKLCNGESCNKDIIPKDRKTCLMCNSTSDPNCHENPKKDELCFKYLEDDICVAKYVDGKTTRGCSADIGNCKELDNYSCKLCSGEKCNKANLKSIVRDDKNIGMWQELPLKCKLCKNENECSSSEKTTTEKCKKNSDECVTIFNNTNNKVEYRGCSSILSEVNDIKKKIYCDTTPELCPQCKSNECNIANSKSEYVKCHYCGWPDFQSCNSDIKEESKLPTRECYKSCMTAAYLKVESSTDPVYNVVRTCLDDKDPEQQNDCKSNDKENCKSCDANNCNSEMLFKDWSNCYTCENAEKCKTPLSKQCESYKKIESCYYLYNDDKAIIKGGCISELTPEERKDFIANNKISFCMGTTCNIPFPKDQKCLKCDSNDDEKCATEPEDYKEKQETCSVPNSKCYLKLENGANVRGCLSSLKDKITNCLADEHCQICDGENCNNIVYPPNRQKCFVCDSSNDEKCHGEPSSAKVCPVYKEDQKCVSKYTDGKTERGCSNELQCDEKDKKKCQICDSEKCNTVDLEKLNSSAMIVCNTILIAVLALLSNSLL